MINMVCNGYIVGFTPAGSYFKFFLSLLHALNSIKTDDTWGGLLRVINLNPFLPFTGHI